MKKNAVLVSAQFLVELPEGTSLTGAESFGVDWLSIVASEVQVLDYRHPKVMGVYIRPVPVTVDIENDDIFDTIKQL